MQPDGTVRGATRPHFARMDKYKSLLAWQRAHALALLSLRSTDNAYHPRARPLFEQMRRAAISVEANIVEGYALGTPNYFRKHLRIAMGSAAELECLVSLARELAYLTPSVTGELDELLGGTMRVLSGLLRKPTHPKL